MAPVVVAAAAGEANNSLNVAKRGERISPLVEKKLRARSLNNELLANARVSNAVYQSASATIT